jgi:hypothetical protein
MIAWHPYQVNEAIVLGNLRLSSGFQKLLQWSDEKGVLESLGMGSGGKSVGGDRKMRLPQADDL